MTATRPVHEMRELLWRVRRVFFHADIAVLMQKKSTEGAEWDNAGAFPAPQTPFTMENFDFEPATSPPLRSSRMSWPATDAPGDAMPSGTSSQPQSSRKSADVPPFDVDDAEPRPATAPATD